MLTRYFIKCCSLPYTISLRGLVLKPYSEFDGWDGWDGWDGNQNCPIIFFVLRYIKHDTHIGILL